MITYLLLWFPMLIIAVLNGTLRELLIKKHASELVAHQLSTVLLLLLFALYTGLVVKIFPLASSNKALLIGLLWFLLTLGFEFGFGRWRQKTWAELLADYNIVAGRIWVLIPLWLIIAPYLFYRLWTT